MIDFAGYSDRKALEDLWQSVFLEDSEITEYFLRIFLVIPLHLLFVLMVKLHLHYSF